jgi:hypothetical protein
MKIFFKKKKDVSIYERSIIMPKSPPTSIRFEENLYDRVVNDAKKEKRSISSQIEYMVEKYYEIMDSLTKPTLQQINRDNAG